MANGSRPSGWDVMSGQASAGVLHPAAPSVAAASEARGPLGPRHCWSLWMDGRWPHLKPRFLEGAALWDPPSAGVVHGVRTLHPRAVCRSQPPPAKATGLEHLRADRR